ncbi:hypothetical protein H4R33_005535 [Dimargaris cristalligena]|uniref:Uncharacterized protein n=1 Tax=Dimargaris cristalligena TaxID=215637 RepID=A0A4P9ZWA6_9FUNG|nr:hypothetical protein H4R33_005535 [Dimargaris cristalligena]RKP37925.1 hypothetical protein BJ085DRAFT_32839 [Dimargaris cristalligena]|eukprot:RKP37925.1 hypothetical protein BJ085DRAFT_32839 [Dimargaris cristalligena]
MSYFILVALLLLACVSAYQPSSPGSPIDMDFGTPLSTATRLPFRQARRYSSVEDLRKIKSAQNPPKPPTRESGGSIYSLPRRFLNLRPDQDKPIVSPPRRSSLPNFRASTTTTTAGSNSGGSSNGGSLVDANYIPHVNAYERPFNNTGSERDSKRLKRYGMIWNTHATEPARI